MNTEEPARLCGESRRQSVAFKPPSSPSPQSTWVTVRRRCFAAPTLSTAEQLNLRPVDWISNSPEDNQFLPFVKLTKSFTRACVVTFPHLTMKLNHSYLYNCTHLRLQHFQTTNIRAPGTLTRVTKASTVCDMPSLKGSADTRISERSCTAIARHCLSFHQCKGTSDQFGSSWDLCWIESYFVSEVWNYKMVSGRDFVLQEDEGRHFFKCSLT